MKNGLLSGEPLLLRIGADVRLYGPEWRISCNASRVVRMPVTPFFKGLIVPGTVWFSANTSHNTYLWPQLQSYQQAGFEES